MKNTMNNGAFINISDFESFAPINRQSWQMWAPSKWFWKHLHILLPNLGVSLKIGSQWFKSMFQNAKD